MLLNPAILTPHDGPVPRHYQLVAARRLLTAEPHRDGFAVLVDQAVEGPEAEPLLLAEWDHSWRLDQDGKPPQVRGVLWRDRAWDTRHWSRLLHAWPVDTGQFSRYTLPLLKRHFSK